MKRISIFESSKKDVMQHFYAKKRQLTLSIAFVMCVIGASAQQKIKDGSVSANNLPNKDAIIEMESVNKGMLFSRVALEGTTISSPLSAHVAGMMIYNTSKVSDVVPGIYYNNGSRWILAGAGQASAISYNPGTYEITYINADNKPVVINLREVVRKNQTVTTLVNNNDGTYIYTSEDGTTTTINVPADVINQFEQITNNATVRQTIENIVKRTGGNVYYDGNTFTYVDKNGVTQTINLTNIVKANETITTLVDNRNGTYSYTAEDGKITTINVPADVINNFQSIANDNSVKQAIENIVKNTAGNVLYDGTNFTYIDNSGNKQIVNISQLIQANETITTLVKNTDGTYTYTNEKNEKVNIDVVGDAITNINNEGNLYTTIKNLVDKTETLTSLVYDASKNTLTYLDEAHIVNVIDLAALVTKNQQTTSLANGVTTEVTSAISPTNPNLTEYKVEVKDGAISTSKLADAAVTTEKIAAKAVTADKLGAGAGTAGRMAVADASGNVSFTNSIPGDAITGANVTAGSDKIILAGNPAGAALKAFSVDVDETKLNLNASQIKGGTNGQIMVVGTDLKGTWVDQSAITSVSNNSSLNTLSTTVNGTTGAAVNIINSNALSLDANNQLLTSTVNGVPSNAIDLSTVINAAQKTTTVSNGANTTSLGTTVGNVTDYKVNVNNASATTTGAVKPGDGLSIDGNGTLSVDAPTITSGKALTSTDLSVSANGATSLLKDVELNIKTGAVNSDKIADGSVTGTDIATKTVTAANLDATGATSGHVATVNADGTVTYQAVNTSNIINGKNLTPADGSIVIGSGTGATLVDANVKVAEGGICTDKIANGAVTINKIANAAPYNVMTTDDAGTPAWVPQSALTPETTVSNTSTENKLTTTVNGTTGAAVNIINSNVLCLDPTGKLLTSMVNGFSSDAVDISPAVAANQKLTTLSNGNNTTVAATTTGNITDYTVNVPTACVTGLGVVKQAATNAAVTINSSGELIVNANNGLSVANGNVQLGGTLTQATAINTTAGNTLAVKGLQTGDIADKVVVADANGVLKQVSSAMPKFFYMPSMMLNTENIGATYTVNLYNEYKAQFTNIPSSQRSSSTANIPFVPTAAELDYYVTYFDNTVVQIISVQADGTLTYKVVDKANTSSFVTIVFVVK